MSSLLLAILYPDVCYCYSIWSYFMMFSGNEIEVIIIFILQYLMVNLSVSSENISNSVL